MKWGLCIVVALIGTTALTSIALASPARVVFGNLVLIANGGFHPDKLPEKTFAPINVQGNATLKTKDGTVPPPLKTVVIMIDKNAHVETRGLPTCQPGRIANTTVAQARAACKNAIVGTGTAKAIITTPGEPPIPATSPLTFFNGPPQDGNATVIIHAYATVPSPTTYVLVTTIEKINKGAFGYKVSTDVPSIAGGNGSLIATSVKIGRIYKYKGGTYGYASARCATGLLQARGKLTFADGTVIAGSFFKPCWVRN
jgi:hypothetical protein